MIQLNKTYKFEITNIAFQDLSSEELNSIFKDGRVASHLIELQLTKWFPELIRKEGCSWYDHIQDNIKYENKNFTKASGCKFVPSKMLGTGRSFNKEEFLDKASKLIYIITDIVDFPKILVRFFDGKDLSLQFPNGSISKSYRNKLFEL